MPPGAAPRHRSLRRWAGLRAPASPRPPRASRTGTRSHEFVDPYAFAPSITPFDLYLFNEGRLLEAWRMLGALPLERDGVAGVRFAVWAPNAERVSVVGDFNGWDGRAASA